MLDEIKRKLFHLTGFIYIVGLIFIPRKEYIWILVAASVGIGIFEVLRIKNPSINAIIIKIFGGALRDDERTKLSGVFWMILGVLAATLISKDIWVAATAITYLLLGDGVASLVGKRFKGIKWPRSRKRVSGSVACFLMCVMSGYFILGPYFPWTGIVVGAVVATIIEVYSFKVNDNILIPLMGALVLKFF